MMKLLSPGLAGQAVQHSRYHLILVTPSLPDGFVDVAEIERVTHPDPHLIARTDRQLQKAPKFRFRAFLATVTSATFAQMDLLARRN